MKTLVLFSLSVLALNALADQDEEERRWKLICKRELILVGAAATGTLLVGGAVVGVTATLIWNLLKNKPPQEEEEKNKIAMREPIFPEGMDRKIDSIEGDHDLFARVSDMSQYLVERHAKDERLAEALMRFTQRSPSEAQAALLARGFMTQDKLRPASAVLTEKQSEVYYPLLFAWVMAEIYNRADYYENKSFRDVFLEIEKEIGARH